MKKIKVSPSIPQHIEVEKVKENHVRLSVYPYESGYAISVAHPLRRLLLASTSGYAPIGIKIDGVLHEFDSVRGMLQDVAEFIINLKGIRFKVKENDLETLTMEYHFTGPKEIFGSDLSGEKVEVVTPDHFLASLNEDADLAFSIILRKGIGYVPSEEIRDLLPEGYIPLDAFFTPVKRALYTIEKILIEDDPNYEKIIFDIETDGQVDPLDALREAYKVFMDQIAIFNSELSIVDAKSNGALSKEDQVLLRKIDTLDLSARSYNCLEKAGIEYVGELLLMDRKDLKSIKNLGKKSLDEIDEKLGELGVDLSSMDDERKQALLERIQTIKANNG
ncbi:MAG: DNA-directed RNA polymerase subunit alpha [Epsilonproteobacteria bacterium]|nr:DNA-directed RNA polymerase subunit alpha [Campylobacterota bacterium]NPA57533.1 DNA-directed RNA polymerase subunit alpha [Campylobacterota bacterium]